MVSFPASNDNCTDGDIRLANGTTENEGRVEICFGNEFGTICDDSWDRKEATVVCRQLGYSPDAVHVVVHGPTSRAFFGHGATPIHLDDLSCLGNETRLEQCTHPGVGNHDCSNEEDAGVVCTGETELAACPGPRSVEGF